MADEGQTKPRCFMAMPITTHEHEAEAYGDDEHWLHVRQTLFERAIRDAGYEPVVPEAKGAYLIHERIVRHLEECELVLCDLSANNPNVFFELGVRTSLDKPIALVWDGLTNLPFDTGGINTHRYDPHMTPWLLEEEQKRLTQHIIDSAESCGGANPLWGQFGLTLRAQQPTTDESPLEAKVDLLAQQVTTLVEARREPTSRVTDAKLLNQWHADTQTSAVLSGFPRTGTMGDLGVAMAEVTAAARALGLEHTVNIVVDKDLSNPYVFARIETDSQDAVNALLKRVKQIRSQLRIRILVESPHGRVNFPADKASSAFMATGSPTLMTPQHLQQELQQHERALAEQEHDE